MKSDRRSPDISGIYQPRHERITRKIRDRLSRTEGEVTVGSAAAWVGTSPYYALEALRKVKAEGGAACSEDETRWWHPDSSKESQSKEGC